MNATPDNPLTRVSLYYHPNVADLARGFAGKCLLIEMPVPPQQTEPFLYLDRQGLALFTQDYNTPFRLSGKALARRGGAGRRSELARACGLSSSSPQILDACAGFGSDGITLAGLGCEVTLVEREPLVWLMLQDRAQYVAGANARLADAHEVLREDAVWDVVYLDPMFPPRRKNALPNRGLQHLRMICGEQDDELAGLLRLALSRARQRVVVKRRPGDPSIAPAHHQIASKSVRFDVYLSG